MLRSLQCQGTGVQERYDITFSERLNLFTGDNGLGKSFVLDLAWWSQTGDWFGRPPLPQFKGPAPLLDSMSGDEGRIHADFDKETQQWRTQGSLHKRSDIVIYASIDGSFAIWDELRERLVRKELGNQPFWGPKRNPKLSATYKFNSKTIMDGLRDEDTGKISCKGLIQDIVDWHLRPQDIQHSGYAYLSQCLNVLCCPGEILGLGDVTRIYVDDVREIPTIKFDYGDVPIVLCSSAVQRIVSFAYLLVWSWREHVQAANLMGVTPGTDLVVIIDELELHLHPKWQRHILRALLQIAEVLNPKMRTQLIATTHSPLVLSSMEPFFDAERDTLMVFKEDHGKVDLEVLPWIKEGSAESWLNSEVFGVSSSRSPEAENAIKAAEDFLEGKSEQSEQSVEADLQKYLPGVDPFLARWYLRKKA